MINARSATCWIVALVAFGALTSPAATAASPRGLLQRLRAVPGLTVVERPAPAGYRYFVMSYAQRVDHARPGRGTFQQRLTLLHRGLGRPTVLHTSGYEVSTTPSRSEPTRLVDGNQISVEQRFFAPSRPEPADWETLDIWQAASDHHRIVAAFKPLFAGRWLSTGLSKGGMASIYHRRFFPGDVDGTIAYAAANDVINTDDTAYTEFFQRVGTPECRAALTALEREVLGPRRADLVARYAAAAQAAGWTFETLQTPDRAFEMLVLDTTWGFWQYHTVPECSRIPAAGASTDELYRFLDAIVGFRLYSDQGVGRYLPYFVQAATELGWPEPRFDRLADLLRYERLYRPRTAIPAWLKARFEPQRMRDIHRWVKRRASTLLFVYGENDPWSAEPFVRGPRTRDSYWYEVTAGNHRSSIAQLTAGQRAKATATLRRWAALRPGAPKHRG